MESHAVEEVFERGGKRGVITTGIELFVEPPYRGKSYPLSYYDD